MKCCYNLAQSYFTLCLLFCSLIVGYAQNGILVDGIFDDWNELPIAYTDADGDGGFSGVDFGQLQVYNDEQYIFFLLDAGTEINLQDLNDVSIYIDTDNNINTGFSINGIGAELVYTFGNRSGFFYGSGNSFEISHSDINLITAPTVTSKQFEISIKRDITLSGVQVFQNDDIKIVFKDNSTNGDLIPAINEVLKYTFSSNNLTPLPHYSIQKLSHSDLRIASYNVLSDGLFDESRIPSFTRIFSAIKPDIIGFQEIYDFTAEQVANQMESILPLTNGQHWHHAKEGPDCHAISKYPILKSALISGYNQRAGNGAFLIAVPNIEKEILFIVAHPPCCSNNIERQVEVDLIMKFLREAKNGNGPIPIKTNTSIVIVGDMNLVGDNRQLETFLSGDIYDEATYGPDFSPDWNGDNLLDSNPYVTNAPFSYTWYNEGSSFGPGKLDYIIYSSSNLTLQNSYALFTPLLPQDSLNAFNFLTDDVKVASDHLPIVADFQFENLTAQNEPSSNLNFGILKIHPNPSLGMMAISFSIPQNDFIDIQLINQIGEAITILHQKNFKYGAHQFQFNTSNSPSGFYYLKLTTSKFIDSKKIIIYK